MSLWDSFVAALKSAAENKNITDLKVAADIAADFTESDWNHKKYDKTYVVYAIKYMIRNNILPEIIQKTRYTYTDRKTMDTFDPEPIKEKFRKEVLKHPEKHKDLLVASKVLKEKIDRAEARHYNQQFKLMDKKRFVIHDDVREKVCYEDDPTSWKECIERFVVKLAPMRHKFSMED